MVILLDEYIISKFLYCLTIFGDLGVLPACVPACAAAPADRPKALQQAGRLDFHSSDYNHFPQEYS
ncbi:MAG: hypothetical protein V1799_12855 [bacterium]